MVRFDPILLIGAESSLQFGQKLLVFNNKTNNLKRVFFCFDFLKKKKLFFTNRRNSMFYTKCLKRVFRTCFSAIFYQLSLDLSLPFHLPTDLKK